MLNLLAHDIPAADHASHHCFIQDERHPRRRLLSQQLLAFHPDFNQIVDDFRREVLAKLSYGHPSITLGLEQTWHEHWLKPVNESRCRLIVNELNILKVQKFLISAPPGAFPRLPRESQTLIHPIRIIYLVEANQGLQVIRRNTDRPGLDANYLAQRPFHGLSHIVLREVGCLPGAAQLRPQSTTRHLRMAT